MTPNPYLLAKKIVQPHKWIRRSSKDDRHQHEFHSSHPVPGTYAVDKNLGFVLLSRDCDHGAPLPSPIQLKRSPIKKDKYLLRPEWDARTTHAEITDPDGMTKVRLMFRLDDHVSWIAVENESGDSIKGPYPRYFVDKRTQEFRIMTKGDCPKTRAQIKSGLSKSEREAAAQHNAELAPEVAVARSQPASTTPSQAPSATPSGAPSLRNETRAPSPDSTILEPATPNGVRAETVSMEESDTLVAELDDKLHMLKVQEKEGGDDLKEWTVGMDVCLSG